jgi:class 3 adenylate cyclase/tetratricopeptide (TPR) repeat protein
VATSQTVTVLFTDLVGSTEMFSSLDPGRADEIRHEHFALLRGAVTDSGGTEVKNLGDGIMVTFSSLSAGISCAARMQQAIERNNRRARQRLAIRVGLSMGEATEEDGDYFGDPVIEASRLCAHAGAGQILTTDMVRAIAGRHSTQELATRGSAVLRGLPGPVQVVEVLWDLGPELDDVGDQLPVPVRLTGTSADTLFAFCGRDNELSLIADVHKRSVAEHRLGVVLVSGEPGIGKTTLVAKAARAAHAEGSNVLYGGAEEDLAVPYRPWVAALSSLVEAIPAESLGQFAEENGLALARLLPALGRVVGDETPAPGTDADAERFMIMEGAVRLLAFASRTAPLVVVLDDLHWADAATLQLLRHLVGSSLPMRVTVVGTFRDSDLYRGHPLASLLADLRREPDVHRVALSGLAEVDVIGLLEAAAGHDMTDEGVALAHALRRETGGNPFFLVELIWHLAENGTFVQGPDGIWRLAKGLGHVGLPGSVREVVAHRVERLGTDIERALSMAAVIGRDFDLQLLAELLDADELRLVDTLERAIGAGLIAEADGQAARYRFVHALIQQTLYQDMSATRRQLAHQRVAETLEVASRESPENLAALAHHWLAATRPTDVTKALYYARRAGEAALGSYAPDDAMARFTEALELLDRQGTDDAPERGRLLVDLGTAQFLAGMPEHRDTLLQAAAIAQRLGDTELLVAAALGGRRGDMRAGVADPERIAVLEAALAAVGDDGVSRALLLLSLAEATDAREWERRKELADQALALASDLPDPTVALDVLLNCYLFRIQPELSGARLVESGQALTMAERLADPVLLFRACWFRVHACMEVADVVEVDLRIEQMAILAQRTGLLQCQWELLITRAGRALMAGDLAQAEALNDEALAAASRIGPEALGAYGGVLFAIRRHQGRQGELVDLLATAASENPAIPVLKTVLAWTYCSLGRPDEARALFSDGLCAAFADVPRDVTWTSTIALWQECAVALDDLAAMEALYGMLEPHAGLVAFNIGTASGALARSLGCLARRLGRADEAEGHFRGALEIHERLQSPYWTAQTQLDLADLLREGEQHAEVRGLSGQALETAQRFGFGGIEQRADAVVASLG